jgi:hypothetical protein
METVDATPGFYFSLILVISKTTGFAASVQGCVKLGSPDQSKEIPIFLAASLSFASRVQMGMKLKHAEASK